MGHRGLCPFLPILFLAAQGDELPPWTGSETSPWGQSREGEPRDHSYWDEWDGCDPTAVTPRPLTSILEVLAKAPTGWTWS